MAWGDPSDYWWLKPKRDNTVAEMQFGAQLRQQAINTALKQKDLQLEGVRTGIQIQEYFSKKELQNRIAEGNAVLAQTASQFSDVSDPRYLEAIWTVGANYPDQVGEPHFDGLLRRHETAVLAKLKLAELGELRLSREQIATDRLTETTARREGIEAFNSEKLALWQQRADTGQMDAESRAEYRDFQKAQSILTHEEVARRLAVMEENAATRTQALNSRIQSLPPERRDLLRRDMDRLDVRAEANEFIQKMPFGTKNVKYGPRYFEERKKLLDGYGVSMEGNRNLPLNLNLKNPITKEEYDRLPSGSEYVAPDGSTRIKK